MLQKPSLEIEREVFAEYDRDFVGFCTRVFEDMEKTNPGLWELIEMILKYSEEQE